MSPFTVHEGRIAVIPDDHVDTDRIIPARYLSRVSRLGFGELLFSDVRGPDFPLDRPDAVGASILVVGTNFGCGSSREHAVWAIQQAGYRALIGKTTAESPAFSDIFRQNSANCGLLLIDLPEVDHQVLANLGNGSIITVDLERQKVRGVGFVLPFYMNEANRQMLLKGLDLIGSTLEFETQIRQYEEAHR